MPTLIVPGGIQVSLHYEVSGQETVNVLGFTSDAIMPADTAADRVHAAWTAAGGPMALLPSAVVLKKVKAVQLSSTTGQIFEKGVTSAGGKGTTLGNLAASAVVRLGSGSRSRSGKGRLYFGPLVSSDMQTDGRSLQPTLATALTTAMNQFKTQCQTGELTLSVLSRTLGVATPVQNISVATILGTQRRRLR